MNNSTKFAGSTHTSLWDLGVQTDKKKKRQLEFKSTTDSLLIGLYKDLKDK